MPRDEMPSHMDDAAPSGVRQLPHSEEGEMALLGGLMYNNHGYARIAEMVKPDHFAILAHRRIFAAMAKLIDAGTHADAVTIKQALQSDPDFNAAGGYGYLLKLSVAAPPTVHLPDYARLIYDLFLRRELIALGQIVQDDAFNEDIDKDAPQLVTSAEERLAQLAALTNIGNRPPPAARSFADVSRSYAERIDRAAKATAGQIMGVPMGITKLDEMTTGLYPGQVTVVAGRPGMGKTVFGITAAVHASRTPTIEFPDAPSRPRNVLYWIGEMDAEDLVARMAAADTGIPVSAQTSSGLDARRADEIIEWTMDRQGSTLFFDDTPAITVSTLRRRAVNLKRQRGHLDLIVIDYLGLMTPEGVRPDASENDRVTAIMAAIKRMAGELRLPILLLSQISRGVETRDDKRPGMSDLRSSGSIEQDATNIVFLYRASEYLKNEPVQGAREKHEDFAQRRNIHDKLVFAAQGKIELILAKCRQGQTGTVLASWQGSRMRIADLQDDLPPAQGTLYSGDPRDLQDTPYPD